MIAELQNGRFVKLKNRMLVFLLVLISLGGGFYWGALDKVASAVLHRQGSSHGIFVPFLAGYFLFLKFEKLKNIRPQTALLPGGAMFFIGLLLFFLGKVTIFQVSVLSFLFVTGGLILVFFGWKIFKETAFPLFFLVTMLPLPEGIYKEIAGWMRYINTAGSLTVIKAFGVPAYRDGYNISLPGLHLVVEYSCSGIRYLLSFFTFSIVYAFLFKEKRWARLLVILASIPLSIIAGISRLSVVFLAAHYIDPFWAEHKPHIFLSWVVFTVFLFGAIGVDQYMGGNNLGKLKKMDTIIS